MALDNVGFSMFYVYGKGGHGKWGGKVLALKKSEQQPSSKEIIQLARENSVEKVWLLKVGSCGTCTFLFAATL